jgi:hypothetical protein
MSGMTDARRTRGRGGRPRLEIPTLRIPLTLSLRAGEDDDLRHWFDGIPPRERAGRVKAALRQGGVSLPRADGPEGEEVLADDAFAALLDAL